MEVNYCGHASDPVRNHWVVPRDGVYAVDNLNQGLNTESPVIQSVG